LGRVQGSISTVLVDESLCIVVTANNGSGFIYSERRGPESGGWVVNLGE
jgi:hypothetical protein